MTLTPDNPLAKSVDDGKRLMDGLTPQPEVIMEPEVVEPKVAAPAPERDMSDWEAAKNSAARGLMMGPSGGAWLMGQIHHWLGNEDLSKEWMAKNTEIKEKSEEMFPRKSNLQAFTKGETDKWYDQDVNWEALGDPTFWADAGPEGAMSLVWSLAGAKGAGKLAQLMKGGKKAQYAAGFAGGGVLGGALEGAGHYDEKIREGYTHEEAVKASGAFGLTVAALSGLGSMKVLNPKAKTAIGSFIVGGMTEGSTEFLESPAGELMDNLILGREIDMQDAVNAGLNEGFLASLMGGGAAVAFGERAPAQKKDDPGPVLEALRRPGEQPFRFMGNKAWIEKDPKIRARLEQQAAGKERVVDAFGGSGTYSGVVQRLFNIPDRVVNEGKNKYLQKFHQDLAEDKGQIKEQAAALVEQIKGMTNEQAAELLASETEKGNSGAYLLAQESAYFGKAIQPTRENKRMRSDIKIGLDQGARDRILRGEILERFDAVRQYQAEARDGWELAKEAGAGDLVLLDPGYVGQDGNAQLGRGESAAEFQLKQLQELKPAMERGASFVFHNAPDQTLVQGLKDQGWQVEMTKRPGEKSELVAYSSGDPVLYSEDQYEDPVEEGLHRMELREQQARRRDEAAAARRLPQERLTEGRVSNPLNPEDPRVAEALGELGINEFNMSWGGPRALARQQAMRERLTNGDIFQAKMLGVIDGSAYIKRVLDSRSPNGNFENLVESSAFYNQPAREAPSEQGLREILNNKWKPISQRVDEAWAEVDDQMSAIRMEEFAEVMGYEMTPGPSDLRGQQIERVERIGEILREQGINPRNPEVMKAIRERLNDMVPLESFEATPLRDFVQLQIQTMDFKEGTGEQALTAILKGRKVKKAQLEFTGMVDWLKTKDHVTIDEIKAEYRARMFGVTTRVLTEDPLPSQVFSPQQVAALREFALEHTKLANGRHMRTGPEFDAKMKEQVYSTPIDELWMLYRYNFLELEPTLENSRVQYGQEQFGDNLQSLGGTDYREHITYFTNVPAGSGFQAHWVLNERELVKQLVQGTSARTQIFGDTLLVDELQDDLAQRTRKEYVKAVTKYAEDNDLTAKEALKAFPLSEMVWTRDDGEALVQLSLIENILLKNLRENLAKEGLSDTVEEEYTNPQKYLRNIFRYNFPYWVGHGNYGYGNALIAISDRQVEEFKDKAAKVGQGFDSWVLRQEGQNVNTESYAIAQQLAEVHSDMNDLIRQSKKPAHPFPESKDWSVMMMKQLIYLAAKEGHKKIAWAKGAIQGRRSGKGTPIKSVEVESVTEAEATWYPTPASLRAQSKAAARPVGIAKVYKIRILTDDNTPLFTYEKTRINETGETGILEKDLDDVLGKRLAKEVKEMGVGTLERPNLMMHNDGMEGFYDDIVVGAMNKFLKQYGVQVREGTLVGSTANVMMSGDEAMRVLNEPGAWEGVKDDPVAREEFLQRARVAKVTHPVWEFDLTDKLKLDALQGELPLYMVVGTNAQNFVPTAFTSAMTALNAGMDPDQVRKQYGWWRGPDGKMRLEVSDETAKLAKAPAEGDLLRNVVDHPEIFLAYPELQSIVIRMRDGTGGALHTYENVLGDPVPVYLELGRDNPDPLDTILHEMQHAVQFYEKFAVGTTPEEESANYVIEKGWVDLYARARQDAQHSLDPYRKQQAQQFMNDVSEIGWNRYWKNYGEVEARAATQRRLWTEQMRRETSIENFMGIDPNEYVLSFFGNDTASRPTGWGSVPAGTDQPQRVIQTVASIKKELNHHFGGLVDKMIEAGVLEIIPIEEFEKKTGRSPRVNGIAYNGKIYLHTGTPRPASVLMHEGTHGRIAGLKNLLGNSYDALQKQFDRLLNAQDKAALRAEERARMAVENRRNEGIDDSATLRYIYDQERLAYYVDQTYTKKTPLFRRIWAAMKAQIRASWIGQKLAELGYEFELTPSMAHELTRLAMRRVVDEAAGGTPQSGMHITAQSSFRSWFDGSKVVDSQGRPQLVYGNGDWFSTENDPTLFDGKELREGYLRMYNPYEVESYAKLQQIIEMYPDYQKTLMNNGWDGIIVREGDRQDFQIFDKSQAMSAREDLPLLAERLEFRGSVYARRLAKILGPKLYGEIEKMQQIVFKEVMQNSADAVGARIEGTNAEGQIKIEVNENDRTITFHDTGVGMDADRLQNGFLRIAGSMKESRKGGDGGGYGFAKLVFLYAADRVQVFTKRRDGKVIMMDTTGEKVMDSIEGDGDPIGAALMTEEEAAVAARMMGFESLPLLEEQSGTTIRVQIPKTYTNVDTGRENNIPFEGYSGWQIPEVLKSSPLFKNIEVTFKGSIGDAKKLPVGKNFPTEDWKPFAKPIKTEWGQISLILKPNEYPFYGGNTVVLSSGLFQFRKPISEDPFKYGAPQIPYDIYMNLEIDVKPDDPRYPLQPNRQDFSVGAEKGMKKILDAISVLYGGKTAEDTAQNFGQLRYLTGGSKQSPLQDLRPDTSKLKHGKTTWKIDPNSTLTLIDGRLVSNGHELPEIQQSDVQAIRINLNDFRIPQEDVDPTTPMLHNNTLIVLPGKLEQKIKDIEEKIAAVKQELKGLREARRIASDAYFDSNYDAVDYAELQDKYYKLREQVEAKDVEEDALYEELRAARDEFYAEQETGTDTKTYKDFVEHFQEKYGSKFNTTMRQIGDIFMELRDAMAKENHDYEDLVKVPVGVSFDQAYRGVHAFVPFQVMMVNPAITQEGVDFPDRMAALMMTTMRHEIAHHVARSHDPHTSFDDALAMVMSTLDTPLMSNFKITAARTRLAAIIQKNQDMLHDMQETIQDEEHVKSIGQSLRDGRESRNDPRRVGELSVSGDARQDSRAMERRAETAALDERPRDGMDGNPGDIALFSEDGGVPGEGLTWDQVYGPTKDLPDAASIADVGKVWFQTAVYYVQDKLQYLYNKQKQWGDLPDEMNPYRMEALYHGRVSERMRQFEIGIERELLEAAAATGRKIDGPGGLDQFLHARHAIEANDRLRRIHAKMILHEIMEGSDEHMTRLLKANIAEVKRTIKRLDLGSDPTEAPTQYMELLNRLTDEGYLTEEQTQRWRDFRAAPTGMTDGEYMEERHESLPNARKILKFEENNQELQRFGDLFDQMNQQALQTRHEAGLITTEEFTKMRDAYQHWAPLRRENFEDISQKRGSGFSLPDHEYMLPVGQLVNVEHILANAIGSARASIVRAERQKVGEALYRLVEAHPDPTFWNIDSPNMFPRLDADGSVRMYKSTADADNEIQVKINGKKHVIWFSRTDVNAYRIAHGLKNYDAVGGWLVGVMNWVNRFLSFVNTSASPEFMITNFSRDFMTAQFNMSDSKADEIRKNMLRDIKKSMGGMRRFLRKEATDPWANWAKDFAEQGGMTGWVQNYQNVDQIESDLNAKINDLKAGPLSWRQSKKVVDFISDYNAVVENGMRLSVYKNLVESGMAKTEAAEVAKELTVNFNRKGAAGPTINALYLFANAGIQGSTRIFMAAKKSAKVRNMMVGTIAAGFLMSIANRLGGGDDDDGIPHYDKIEQWIKERNMIFMLGDGKYAKLPLPWGFNVLWVLGDQMASAAQSEDYSVMGSTGTVLHSFLGAFSPIQGGTWLQAISPTIFDPAVQIAENKTFTGAPLKPENNPWLKVPAPEHQLYWNSAREGSVELAKLLSDWTGGDELEGGIIDWSPEHLDLIADTVLGSAGRFLTDSAQGIQNAFSGEIPEARKFPLLRRVYGDDQNTVDNQIYRKYTARVWLEHKRRKEKIGEPDRKVAALYGKTMKTEKTLRRLHKLKKQAATDERKEQIEARIQATIMAYNREYRLRTR